MLASVPGRHKWKTLKNGKMAHPAMVDAVTDMREITPIQRLVLSAGGARRAQAELAVALDNECAHIARSAREPMMAQIRLAWWRDGLASMEALPAHRSPMMDALRSLDDFPAMRDGLIGIIDGWEELILWDGGDRQAMLETYAKGRGEGFFLALAPGREAVARPWGRLWALWDLAGHLDEAELAGAAVAQGAAQVRAMRHGSLSSLPRMLVMLGGAARHDLARGKGMPSVLTTGLYMRLLRLQILGR